MVYELLKLDDDFYDLAEIAAIGLMPGQRFDPTADNSALFKLLAETLEGLVAQGYLELASWSPENERLPLPGVPVNQQVLHYLEQLQRDAWRRVALPSLEVSTTRLGESALGAMHPVIAAARPA